MVVDSSFTGIRKPNTKSTIKSFICSKRNKEANAGVEI